MWMVLESQESTSPHCRLPVAHNDNRNNKSLDVYSTCSDGLDQYTVLIIIMQEVMNLLSFRKGIVLLGGAVWMGNFQPQL